MKIFGLFLFCIGIAGVMYTAAPRIGVVDVRYIPIGQLVVCLMGAMGLGQVIGKFRRWKIDGILLLVLVAGTMIWTNTDTQRVSGFARWNYEGFEKKPDWPLFQNINRVLSGSFQDPRVIYEHSSIHNRFGTTRAFESLPLFAGRATLEGVYMQASISAPFIFYIQSEISKEKSTPYKQYIYTDMDFNRATYHLSLFNVKELILVSEQAKTAIRQAQGYRLKRTIDAYEIWELERPSYRYVVPLENEPILYDSDNWKIDAYRWFIDDRCRGVHLVFPMNFSKPDEALFKARARSLENLERIPIDTKKAIIKETILEDRILIETNWIGKPLLVKMSYHPNWRVEGASKIYKISPSFMLIYPDNENVRLIYGYSWPDWAGLGLTGIGLILLLLSIPPLRRVLQRYGFNPIEPLPIFTRIANHISWDPKPNIRRNLMIAGTVAGILILAGFSYDTFRNDPDRWFNRAVKLKDAKQYDAARVLFDRVMQRAGSISSLTSDSIYYIAICYFLEDRNRDAIGTFERLIDRFPNGLRDQEALYHIGLCYFRLGEEQRGVDTMRQVWQRYPGTIWAGYAKERLLEHHAWTEQDGPVESLSPGEKMGQAMYLFNHDLLAEAQSAFEDIVQKYPLFQDAPQALACLALVHYKKNECMKTIEYYQRLIDQYTDSRLVPEAYYHIGLCREKMGDSVSAKNAFNTILERYPESQWADYVREKMGE